jgi:Kef-type K+ transport system membrane component KefB
MVFRGCGFEVLFGPIFKKLQQNKPNGCLVIGVIWAHFYKIVATQTKAY